MTEETSTFEYGIIQYPDGRRVIAIATKDVKEGETDGVICLTSEMARYLADRLNELARELEVTCRVVN